MASTSEDHRIIVIGGYGHVGATIVASLAPRQPGRVIVAGRSLPLARKLATQVGHGTTARRVDITSPGDVELEGVDVVVVCVDQSSATFAQRCLSAGIHYVDITAGWEFLRTVEEFDDIARQAGATAILSVGVAPGLTNQLATHLAKRLGPLRRLDIVLELGLGDAHGTSAVDWMLDQLTTRYTVRMGGDEVVVRSLSHYRTFELPGRRRRRAYRFPLPDQHVLARHIDAHEVSTWLRLSSSWVTWLLATAGRLGFGRALRRPRSRRVARWVLERLRHGSDVCTIAAFAQMADGARATVRAALSGPREARMTGVAAAETVRQLLEGAMPPGVFHSEAVLELSAMQQALSAEIPGFRSYPEALVHEV